MVNKILKGLGLGLLMIVLVTNTVQIYQIKNNLIDKSNEDKLIYYEIDGIRLDLDNLSDKIQTEPDLKKLLKSSVFVQTLFGIGSGTIIKKTNNAMYILTCNHVVDKVIEMSKKGFSINPSVGYSKNGDINNIVGLVIYDTKIVKYDKEVDLALLKIELIDNDLEVISIAEKEPEQGDIVYSIGNPLGMLRTLSKGILSNKVEGFFISDNTITFGNSGGGLFNKNGELIGVPSQVMVYESAIPESNLGMSRNLKTIKDFLNGVEY